jgi:hypothetical protein
MLNTNSAVTTVLESSRFTYHYHEAEDIHEIQLINANQHTMKDFFQLIGRIYYATPASGTTRILICQTGPALPLSHFMNEVRAFINQHRKMPQSAPARFAIVLELTPFLQLLKQMLKLMRHQDAVTFFDRSDNARARVWLQQSK